jgi:5-methylcytosine-specific restriction endonuclease McrA
MKKCRVCGLEKPLNEYPVRRDSGDGHRNECRSCNLDGKRAYYEANRVAILEHQKAVREADPETFYAKRRERHRLDPERRNAYMRKYKKRHRAAVYAPVKRWHQANRERMREMGRKSEAKRRARKLALPYEDVDPRVVFKRDKGVCGICGELVDPSDWHLDHVIPLVQGGPHTYANVQTTHPFCNLSKGGRGHERQKVV